MNTNQTRCRIEDIRRATVNGRAVKIFKAYRLQGDAYVFAGQFSAPVRTANKNLLHTFIRNARGRCEDAPCCGCCTI